MLKTRSEKPKILFIFLMLRVGEIAQWLRVLVALAGDLVHFPAPPEQLTSICSSSSGVQAPSSGSASTGPAHDTKP